MNKHDVFQFTAPNGVEVTAVVLHVFKHFNNEPCTVKCDYVCYAQNKLFTCSNIVAITYPDLEKTEYHDRELEYGEVIVDYAILPDFDEQLRKFTLNEEIMNTFSPDDYANDGNHDSQQDNS